MRSLSFSQSGANAASTPSWPKRIPSNAIRPIPVIAGPPAVSQAWQSAPSVFMQPIQTPKSYYGDTAEIERAPPATVTAVPNISIATTDFDESVPATPLRRFASTPRGWPAPSTARRASISSNGVDSLQRVHVQGLSRTYSSASAVRSDRGVPPSYENHTICTLASLATSSGKLVPSFRPDDFMYTLYVASGTRDVLFNPISSDGMVVVDGRSARIPVRLSEPHSTKVVVSIRPRGPDISEGRYHINVVFGEPKSEGDVTRPELYLVMFDFYSESSTELSVRSGDVVRIIDKEGPWWFGCRVDSMGASIDEVFGYFPGSYLRPLVLFDDEKERSFTPTSELKRSDDQPVTSTMRKPQKPEFNLPEEPLDDKAPGLVEVATDKNYYFTMLMIAVYFIMLLVSLGTGGISPKDNPMIGPKFDTLRSLGGRWVQDILRGKVYLLFTELFLPVGIISFLLDLALFWFALGSLEQYCGILRTFLIFFVSGIIGNLTGGFFVPRWLVTGSSSALFGTAAALFCLVINRRGSKGPAIITRRDAIVVAVCLSISLIFGTFPGLDNFSQIGGLFAGYCACLAFASDAIDPRPQIANKFAFLGIMTLGFLFVVVCMLQFLVIDINQPCKWCMEATCIPANDWCGAGRLGGPIIYGSVIWATYHL
jgi:rhomboid protease GluP